MKYRSTPLKQVTQIPGYDPDTGRLGTINLNKSQQEGQPGSGPTTVRRKKQSVLDFEKKCYNADGSRKRGVAGCEWSDETGGDWNPESEYENVEVPGSEGTPGTESQDASFTPSTTVEKGKPGTTVDTFTAPNTRETIRTGKITANKMANMGKKQGRIQNRAVKQGFGTMENVLDADGNPTGKKEFKLKELNPGDKGYNKYRRFKENLSKVESKRSKVEDLDDTIVAAGEAGVNARNRSDFEYGTKKTGPTEDRVVDAKITQEQIDSGNYEKFDADSMNYEDKPIMNEEDKNPKSNSKMKSSAFKMKYNHSPSKMYNQAKEKSSALKMWGASKVEDGNKLFFDKSLFKGQNKATRPMTSKASAFKMKGYNK
jgi:hypothetical protein